MKNQKPSVKLFAGAILMLLSFFAVPEELVSQEAGQDILSATSYRAIGPSRISGRFVDFAVYEKDPAIFYAAMATGGL